MSDENKTVSISLDELNERIAEGVAAGIAASKKKDEEEAEDYVDEIVHTARVGLYKGNVIHSVKDGRDNENAKGKTEREMTVVFYEGGKLKEKRGFKSELSRDFTAVRVPYQVNTEYKDVKSEKVAVNPTTSENGNSYALQHSVGGKAQMMTLKVTKEKIKEGYASRYTVTIDGKEYDINRLNLNI